MSVFGIERFRPGYQPKAPKGWRNVAPTPPKGGTAVVSPPVYCSHVAKCAYCGRYGDLGSCAGCGAPNLPHTSMQRIDVTHLRSPQGEPQFIDAPPAPPASHNPGRKVVG